MRTVMVVSFGLFQGGPQMRESIFIGKHRFGRIGGGYRIVDGLVREPALPKMMCQRCLVGLHIIAVSFLDRCPNLAV